MKSLIFRNYFLILIVYHLKISSSSNYNTTFICEIIGKINLAYKIETLPIFRDNSFENDFQNFPNLFQHFVNKLKLPQFHFVNYSSEELRFKTNSDYSLPIILTRPGSFDALRTSEGRLNRMHNSKILIVLSHPVVLKDLEYLRNWMSQEKFFDVVVLFEDKPTKQNRLFTIDPYPTVKWLNRTHLLDSGEVFLKHKNNLKQYRIETPFTEDVPRVFFYTQNGKQHLVGRNANIIMLFAKHMNITLVKTYQPNMDLNMILNQLPDKKSELSFHSYSMFFLNDFGWSYPLDMVYFCVMLPFHVGVPKNQYFVTAFDWGTWLAIAFSVLFIAVLMKFVDPRLSTIQDNDAGMRYFFRSLALMTYSSNMSARMISPNIRQFVFFGLVFLLAFILSCFYSTFLTSFCTEKVYRRPIETVEGLSRANLRIMIIDYELGTAQQYSHFGDQFLQLLYPVPYFEVIKRRDNFDYNFAYTIQHDRWFYLHKQQRGLKHPMFRLSNICFGPHYLVFPLRENSHLQPYLFDFFLRVVQAGLDSYWEEEAFRLAVAMNHSKVLVDRTVFVQPLNLDYFQYVFAGWLVGLGISTVNFIDELFRKRRLQEF
ncbi:uncharacterized protein LOC129912441 [Episyrphus balteatus]|uniref:uncharacterized protein LOC129912441 n=1 Tax=Episyrphus balteatus TaxID=286459 RepID=UPI0024855C49|nr:uncharacterized protein LOC129912441 [Episyrphus balteatus]